MMSMNGEALKHIKGLALPPWMSICPKGWLSAEAAQGAFSTWADKHPESSGDTAITGVMDALSSE